MGPNQRSLMKYPEVHEHPYLHLFPELKHIASQSEEDISYIPFMNTNSKLFDQRSDHFDLAGMIHSGLTYFIYNPWFEQVQYRSVERRVYYFPDDTLYIGLQSGEPYWFGDNSTRGMLAETVAKLLEEAKLPSVEPYPRNWWTQQEYKSGRSLSHEVGERSKPSQ